MALLVTAAFVIFVLPEFVSPPEPPEEVQERDPTAGDNDRRRTDDAKILSPSEQIRQMRYRREAQDLLALAVDLQLTLENQKADLWAPQAFDTAVQQISQGDEAFGAQVYEQAKRRYADAVANLEKIQASEADIADRLAGEAAEALATNDLENARAKAGRALLVNARHDGALLVLQRIDIRPELLARLEEGAVAEQAGDLRKALGIYRSAVTMDNDYTPSREAASRVQQAIADVSFDSAMSLGLLALQSDEFDTARKAFEAAMTIKPAHSGPRDALRRLAARQKLLQIQDLEQRAEQAIREERWQDAAEFFTQALTLDGDLVSAQEGRERAVNRHALDQKLQEILADTKQLGQENIYQGARRIYQSVRQLQPRGDRLGDQIERLGEALRLAAEPLNVHFVSDNFTSVRIHRMSELGRFKSREVSLRPGRYTAHGSRSGYRDVIRIFDVEPGITPEPIAIRCTEKI